MKQNAPDDSRHAATHYFSRHSPRRDEEDEENDRASSRPDVARRIETRARRDGQQRTLRLATGSGTFARAGLDAGSALLIERARFSATSRVLDLGCGWGALGCFCASFESQSRVWMCDINRRAVLLAHSNARENDLTNITAWRGDGAEAARADFFDVVLCNPPIRAGNAVIARLFDDAQRVLKSGGALWVVIRTAQGAKSWQRRLREQFGNCETIAIESGYRILKSVK